MPKRKRRNQKPSRARGRSRARRRRVARAAARRRLQLARARKRSAAAYKGQITRLKQQLAQRPELPPGAGETIIFQSPTEDDAESVFKPIDEYRGLSAVTWQADLLWIHQGVTIEQERLPFPPAWEGEALGQTFRRQAKAWIDAMKLQHPELGDESPAAGVVRIALASA